MPRTPINPLLTTSLTPSDSSDPTYIYALSLLPSAICALTSASTLHLLSTHTLQPTRVLTTPHTLLATYTPHTLLTTGASKTLTLHDLRTPTPTTTTLLSPPPPPPSPSPLRPPSSRNRTHLLHLHNPYLRSPQSHISDAQVNVFDTSVPAGTAGEGDDEVEGALRTTINHGSSVHRVGFLGENLWAVSHDEVMGVYVGNGEGETYALGDEWVVAGNKEAGWVDFVELEGGWGLGEGGYRLVEGEMGGEVCRGVVVDGETNTIFTGGEDGLVKAWRPPTTTTTTTTTTEESAEVEKKERRKEKKEKKDGEKKKRYKPY
ncbi:hypothetical protein BDD12DRAFT_914570 [Trichophaea hybrida]|nr:hypothetical protein BDD12DRAFT_914570 [Trichophaea hybrida]